MTESKTTRTLPVAPALNTQPVILTWKLLVRIGRTCFAIGVMFLFSHMALATSPGDAARGVSQAVFLIAGLWVFGEVTMGGVTVIKRWTSGDDAGFAKSLVAVLAGISIGIMSIVGLSLMAMYLPVGAKILCSMMPLMAGVALVMKAGQQRWEARYSRTGTLD